MNVSAGAAPPIWAWFAFGTLLLALLTIDLLAFAGGKLVSSTWFEIPPLPSVAFIVLCIGASVWPSIVALKRLARRSASESAAAR